MFEIALRSSSLLIASVGSAQVVVGWDEYPAPVPAPAQFSYDVTALGDLDGDGIGDYAAGDRYWNSSSGAVWIFFPAADGSLKASQQIAGGIGGFTEHPPAHSWFGMSVEAAGDRDGDGITDLYVGAPSNGAACGACSPYVYLLYLESDGTVKDHLRIGEGEGGFTIELEYQDRMGHALALLDDIDGTGTADLAISTWDKIWVCRTAPDGSITNNWEVAKNVGGGTFEGGARSMTALPDLDGDGIGELLLGQPGGLWETNSGGWGELLVYFLNPIGTIHDEVHYQFDTPGFPATISSGDAFGASVHYLGDIDGDGTGELAVGAPGVDDDAGALWILGIDEGAVVVDADKISQDSAWPGALFADNDGHFGSAVAGGGDLDGDGVHELLVAAGSWWPGGRLFRIDLDPASYPAGSTVVSGTGLNPIALESTSPPIVGGTWEGALDTTALPGATAYLLFANASLLPSGIDLGVGELLVDLFSPSYMTVVGAVTAATETFEVSISPNPGLLGLEAHLQAVLVEAAALLTNALTLELGV